MVGVVSLYIIDIIYFFVFIVEEFIVFVIMIIVGEIRSVVIFKFVFVCFIVGGVGLGKVMIGFFE